MVWGKGLVLTQVPNLEGILFHFYLIFSGGRLYSEKGMWCISSWGVIMGQTVIIVNGSRWRGVEGTHGTAHRLAERMASEEAQQIKSNEARDVGT